jgi:hypothetical protein
MTDFTLDGSSVSIRLALVSLLLVYWIYNYIQRRREDEFRCPIHLCLHYDHLSH